MEATAPLKTDMNNPKIPVVENKTLFFLGPMFVFQRVYERLKTHRPQLLPEFQRTINRIMVLKLGDIWRVLKGPVVSKGEGVFLGNPGDSVWEDWGTLRKTTPPLKNPIINTWGCTKPYKLNLPPTHSHWQIKVYRVSLLKIQ